MLSHAVIASTFANKRSALFEVRLLVRAKTRVVQAHPIKIITFFIILIF